MASARLGAIRRMQTGSIGESIAEGRLETGESPGQLETDERNAWARAAAES